MNKKTIITKWDEPTDSREMQSGCLGGTPKSNLGVQEGSLEEITSVLRPKGEIKCGLEVGVSVKSLRGEEIDVFGKLRADHSGM